MTKVINRLYDTYADAVATIRDLEAHQISHNDISIVANNVDRENDPTHKDAAGKGAGGGAAAGGAVGAGAGLLAGLGMMAIPGLGPVVAAGWLIATAAGAAAGASAGALAGGIIGKLTEYEVSEDDAHVYLEAIRRGGALVSVKVNDDKRAIVEDLMDNHGFVDVAARRQAYRANEWSAFDPNAEAYDLARIEAERTRYL